MATYGEKIAKYEARVRKALELNLDPRDKDLEKLYYYTSRAEKKGADHDTKLKDKAYWAGRKAGKAAKTIAKELLAEAAKALVTGGPPRG
ncbi:MAG: hypothetical protein ABSF35_07065 [Polyangia bacterium]|jgi:hypothetical protein